MTAALAITAPPATVPEFTDPARYQMRAAGVASLAAYDAHQAANTPATLEALRRANVRVDRAEVEFWRSHIDPPRG